MSTVITDLQARQLIAANVSAKLEEFGWSQSHFATLCDINRMDVSRACRAETVPLHKLIRMAEVFSCGFDDFLKPIRKFGRKVS